MTATTTYRPATTEDIDFFRTHGYIVVRDVIDPDELDSITELCDKIIENKETHGVRLGLGEGQEPRRA